MKVRVQLVENNPLHKVPSIFLNIHRTQFIFNVIPTLLRHRKKHKLNLFNSSHIFFTKNSIQAFGGLPNYLLFRSGAENSDQVVANKIYLYGNNQLINYLQKLRFKLGYKSLRISYSNWLRTRYRFGIQSMNLFNKIKASPELPSLFARMEQYLVKNCHKKDYFDSRYYLSNVKTKYITADCTYFHTNLLDIYPIAVKSGNVQITHYLCIFPQFKKDVDLNTQQFVQQTGITKQQALKELISKGFITFEGKNYRKQDYLFKQNFQPRSILIFHHVDAESVRLLLTSQILSNYFLNNNKTGLIVHIVQDLKLLETDDFHRLINKFQGTTKHLWFNHQLNQINERNEHILEENILEQKIWSQLFPSLVKNIYGERMKFYRGNSQTDFNLLFPGFSHYLYKRVYNFVKNEQVGDSYQERLEQNPKPDIISLLKEQIKRKQYLLEPLQQLAAIETAANSTLFQAKVTFLGTSSSMPTASRNTSGILVNLNSNHSVLLDCGEQTYQQIINHFSPEEYESELLKLKVIFITHIHSDHNLGILNLISQRRKIMKKKQINDPLFLIIPFNVYNWYKSYNAIVQDLSDSCHVLFTQILLSQSYEDTITKELDRLTLNTNGAATSSSCYLNNYEEKLFVELEVSAKTKELVTKQLPYQKEKFNKFNSFLAENQYQLFQPVRVIHCPQSFGIVISNRQYKVSYSGDTRPSESFKEQAKKSNLMIHEATFNDEQAKKARQFLHSTVQQAMQIGLQSESQKLALTHFNFDFKVHSKLKQMSHLSQYFQKHTIFSFDHLEIRLDHMHLLPSLSKFISSVNQKVYRYAGTTGQGLFKK